MNFPDNKKQMLDLAEKLGIPASELRSTIDVLSLNEVHIIDMLPEMVVMIRSMIAKKTFTYRRKPMDMIKKGLLFSFQNIISHPSAGNQNIEKFTETQPHVRITPFHLESEVVFPKGFMITQITILIELDFLRDFLGGPGKRSVIFLMMKKHS